MVISLKQRFLIISVILLQISRVSLAQFYDTGQDPSSLKWVQIRTGRFNVIYPERYGINGKIFAKSLEDSYAKLGSLFPEKKFRIPIVIHSYTTISNGYVAWAPKRMEIYPTPEQNTIPLDPVKQLTLHELTHVIQMEALNKGFSKGMSILFGEQIYGVVAFLMPLWYMEGNAVFAETALTDAGRGRSPSFQKQFKAISVEKGKMYSYDQIVSGSFKNYIPNHYESGYQLVSWAMTKHDPQTWNKMLDYTAKYPFTLNPVNLSLRKSIGLKKKNLYRETFDTLKTVWTHEISENGANFYAELNPSKKGNYINYYSPVVAGKESIIAVRTSLSKPPAFVLINTAQKTEKVIHVPGQIYPYYISYGNGIIAWVETRNDPRWANRQFSIIKLMDIHTKEISSLNAKSRYLSVAISPDASMIAASENTSDNKNYLVFIDAFTGMILKSVPSPGNAYIQRPQWSVDGNTISMISLTEAGEGILAFSIKSHEWKTLIPGGNNDLQSTTIRNDSLFFVSSFSGTDNIYVLSPDSKISAVTNSRFGTADLCLDSKRIIFSDYTSMGNNLCSEPISTSGSKPDSLTGSLSFLINRFKVKPAEEPSIDTGKYVPVPYRKWQHLFRFHSWMPFYADLQTIKSDPTAVRPGLTLFTQNTLSTLISSIGYEYSQDKKNLLHARITWQGWYPVFESQIDYGYNPSVAKFGESVDDPTSTTPGFQFTNTVSVPLNFSTGRFYQYLRPSFTSDYFNNYVYVKETGTYDYGQNLLSGRIYFSNYYTLAYRDIYPKWAQVFDINYTFAPSDRNIYGTEFSFRSAFYIPGFLPGNGIKLRFEKEIQDPQKYLLSSRISLPRGYQNIISKDINFLSADYVMPLVYPDFNIASLLYLKRIRTSLFYDFAQGTGNTYYENTAEGLKAVSFHDYQENFSSAGFELMADFHIFRIPYMISGGIQSAWTRESSTPVFKVLFNIDLFGMAIGRAKL
jgi:hypothetical protein